MTFSGNQPPSHGVIYVTFGLKGVNSSGSFDDVILPDHMKAVPFDSWDRLEVTIPNSETAGTVRQILVDAWWVGHSDTDIFDTWQGSLLIDEIGFE